jgi:uncharacterized membrane protein YkvA (DUF1232 family)
MADILERLKQKARQLKQEIYALYLAYRDPRVPLHAKIFAACVVGYAFSPIDLIPDPIPILGYLDDLILIPIGISLAIKMIPAEVMAESRVKASQVLDQGKPVSWVAAGVIAAIWVCLAVLVLVMILRALR